MGYDWFYFLKKAYPIFPGTTQPVSAGFLAEHYRRRAASRSAGRRALDMVVGSLFKAWIPLRARAAQRKYGYDDAWRRSAVAIARERFADPNDIALFRIERAEQLDSYIRRFEDAALNKRINPAGWTSECALADKLRFAHRCADEGLPAPELVASVVRGAVTIEADPAGRALIAKPTDGEGGSGFQKLGTPADAEVLTRLLKERFGSSRATWVVQPLVPIHPDLADLALGALPTLRIVTILDEAGMPEVVSATLRFASDPAAEVDNMKAGGLLSAVDLPSGAIGVACKGYGGGDYERHPVTGAPITGRVLPHWEESKALVVRAHQAFGEYALIGWDVAMTPEGPLLIEGNGKPGVLMPQRAARVGLGATRYGQLLAHHLDMAARRD